MALISVNFFFLFDLEKSRAPPAPLSRVFMEDKMLVLGQGVLRLEWIHVLKGE